MFEPFGFHEIGHVLPQPIDGLPRRFVLGREAPIGQGGDGRADVQDRARANPAVDLLQFVAALLEQVRAGRSGFR